MKLTEIQHYKLSTGLQNLSTVLQEVKQKTLKGKELEDMQLLESAVQNVEILIVTSKVKKGSRG